MTVLNKTFFDDECEPLRNEEIFGVNFSEYGINVLNFIIEWLVFLGRPSLALQLGNQFGLAGEHFKYINIFYIETQLWACFIAKQQ